MAGITYNAFNIQVTAFPVCGSVTIEDQSTWPTPALYGSPIPFIAFDRADVKLVIFWRDDAGTLHWDITDPTPGIWTVPGYTTNGFKNIEVYAVPVAFIAPPGRHGSNDNDLSQGMVIFDPSDSNYYLVTTPWIDPAGSYPSALAPGNVVELNDTVMTVDQIRNYFNACWLAASAGTNYWSRYQHLFAYQNVGFYIYCAHSNLALNFNESNDCSHIILENETETPMSIMNAWNFQWQNSASAIFVVDSAGVLVAGGYYPNTTNLPENYTIPITGNGIYTVYVFVNERYFSYLAPYVANDIVYNTNTFMISDGAGNFNPVPFTLVGLQTFLDYNNTGGGWSGQYIFSVNVDCSPEDSQFEIEIGPGCDYISLRDITPWPVMGGTWNREDSGIAVWYNYNGSWFYDVNNFGTNATPGEWLLPITGNGIYTIYSFVLPKWKAFMTHHINTIVYYNGAFYLANAPHGAGETAPDVHAGWQLLTAADFQLFYNYWHGTDIDFYYGLYQTQVSITCVTDPGDNPVVPDIPIINSACHQFTVLNPFNDNTQNVAVKLYPLDMSEVIDCQIIDVINGESSVGITTATDGVYVVQIGYQDPDTNTCEIDYDQEYVEYPIYDFCNALTCYNALGQMLLCNELDPCCRNCDPEFIEKKLIYREELNKMIALMFELYALLNIENLDFVGYNLVFQQISENIYQPFSIDRNMIIGQISDIIAKLAEVSGRCGDCNGPRTDQSKKPCENCGGNSNV